ncbi:MAG: hypothetical protein Q4E17_04975, partial [Synergistes sp.]|nr:hypothetical protein [Synergistes sp.]
MPQLLLIAASGTAQRRILEECTAELEKKGYAHAGRQEGGEWSTLIADSMNGGLFDDKRYVVVESAPLLGVFPEKFSHTVEETSDTVIVLVYESETKMQPQQFIPKDVTARCRVLKADPFPRWPRERCAWVLKLAKETGVRLMPDGAEMVVEMLDDPEEIRAQLKAMSFMKKNAAITARDVEEMCMDDGNRDVFRLLDGLCTGDQRVVIKSFRSISKTAHTVIPTLTTIYNRMRLAWYAGLGKDSLMFAKSLGAKDYAWRMAGVADRAYGHDAITDFITDLIRINIDERSGLGSGWGGLETSVIRLL